MTRKSRKVLIEATVTLANARQQGQCLLADDADKWQADVDHLLPLVDAIVSQTERCLLITNSYLVLSFLTDKTGHASTFS
ncbi:hypothetical protein [Endozoicomonas sp. SCSIO W0465]|uniref:hypothetical protein n=1 Tax=Endozoicomonas sp. SCSIO W0465 TaxID=2918516 RepID=UPI002074D59A|nr:hypothetical protein [Endozoicomonas sp. SCSIO W0465]USE37485.1 hypothetical protein MJO57_04485 [Endozoicomonas sp. SCSIO W0465]